MYGVGSALWPRRTKFPESRALLESDYEMKESKSNKAFPWYLGAHKKKKKNAPHMRRIYWEEKRRVTPLLYLSCNRKKRKAVTDCLDVVSCKGTFMSVKEIVYDIPDTV